MRETILISGATSGIGFEMAKILAKQNYNLVLVARSDLKLEEIKLVLNQKYKITVTTFALDLSVKENVYFLYDEVLKRNIQVDMLVNNAGVGNYGEFVNTSLEEELKMIDLNCGAVIMLTKLFAKDMVVRKSGRIMNVASLLSYLPFPYYAVYSATKSFVLAFTETIAAELDQSGITITALCPGPVDTPFQTEDMLKTNAYKANKPVKAYVVAEKAVALLLHGRGKKIPGFNNWFISNLPRITPDFLMMKIKKNLASPSK